LPAAALRKHEPCSGASDAVCRVPPEGVNRRRKSLLPRRARISPPDRALPPSIGPREGTFVAFPGLGIEATLREPCLHQLENFEDYSRR